MSHSLEAEMSVLGSMILDPNMIDVCSEFLTARSFYSPAHSEIFDVLRGIRASGGVVDLVTLREGLKGNLDATGANALERCGGVDYLMDICEYVPSAANAKYYSRIVRDYEAERCIASIGSQDLFEKFASESDIKPMSLTRIAFSNAVIAKAESILSRGESTLVSITDMIRQTDDALVDAKTNGVATTGDSTGFSCIDNEVGGFVPGWHYVIGAYSGMGKTAFIFKLMTESARISKKPWLFVSLEMTREDLMARFVARLSGISFPSQRVGSFTDRQYEDWNSQAGDYLGAPLYVEDDPSITVGQVELKMREIVARHGCIGGVAVDYLQLMADDGKGYNTSVNIDKFVREMKGLAKKHRCSVVSLSQINRAGLGANDAPRRPTMADLKGSGGIEASADVILLLHRDRQIGENPRHWHPMDVIVAKHRFGHAGAIYPFQFLPFRTDFRVVGNNSQGEL